MTKISSVLAKRSAQNAPEPPRGSARAKRTKKCRCGNDITHRQSSNCHDCVVVQRPAALPAEGDPGKPCPVTKDEHDFARLDDVLICRECSCVTPAL